MLCRSKPPLATEEPNHHRKHVVGLVIAAQRRGNVMKSMVANDWAKTPDSRPTAAPDSCLFRNGKAFNTFFFSNSQHVNNWCDRSHHHFQTFIRKIFSFTILAHVYRVINLFHSYLYSSTLAHPYTKWFWIWGYFKNSNRLILLWMAFNSSACTFSATR